MPKKTELKTELEVVKLNLENLSNKKIGKILNLNHKTVCKILKKYGIKLERGTPPIEVDNEHSICKKCKTIVLKENFALIKSSLDGRRLSICQNCRKMYGIERLNVLDTFLHNKQVKLKNRTKIKNIICNLPNDYIKYLYNLQNGKCFYTNREMICKSGQGLVENTLSIDKIIPSLGYIENNVVLCINKFNMIKNNLSLEEIKIWMPLMYEKIKKYFIENNKSEWLITNEID